MDRRLFLNALVVSSIPLLSGFNTNINVLNGFFTVAYRKNRWFLIDPEGKPFFSTGINHIDPASLRYPENIHLWKQKYNGSTIKWLKESVAPNLKKWGFNTLGWEQEVTVREWPHSRSFTKEEYQALNMPYCRMLPFTQSHQWEKHTQHYDFYSVEWKEWCEYTARAYCAELNDNSNLIGYFFSDCPTWIHSRESNKWRGPIYDPSLLQTEKGKKELFQLATQYYKTIHDAIRIFDKNHLLLGDRYEANAPIAHQVVEAALPFVDVLSFQDFKDPVTRLKYWYDYTNKPVLLADAAKIKWDTEKNEFSENNGQWYADTLMELFENKGCIGFHLCGAYQRNKARRYGLLDEQEQPDVKNLELISKANFTIRTMISKI